MGIQIQPTRDQLQQALQDCGCVLDLDRALAYPALRIALTNYAIARIRTVGASEFAAVRRFAPRFDWRALASGEN